MKKIITIFSVLLTLKGYSQKYTQAQMDSIINFSTASEEIAPDFIEENSILVVFKDTKKDINKYLEKKIEKEYKGEYRLIEPGEALSKNDTSKTRFFISIISRFNAGQGFGNNRISAETVYQMLMMDRKIGKTYYFKQTTSCYSCLFEEYFKKLEKLRIKIK